MNDKVVLGDCLEVMKDLPDDCVDAIVTDPPYGLGFMGKAWDHGVPGVLYWTEALRVAKPGAYLLAFGGTRMYHRLAVAIEDAGWEIRDSISWLYGCLSEDTEILINGVWVHYRSAIEGSLALCYDAENDTFSQQPVEQLFVYDYDDTAYRIESARTDQVVSRNHRCLVWRDGRWGFVLAEEVAREQEARVPVLEAVSDVLDALSLLQPNTGSSQQFMRRVSDGGSPGSAQEETNAPANGHDRDRVCGLRQEGVEAALGSEGGEAALMLPSVQREAARSGVGEARAQGLGSGEPGGPSVCRCEDDRPAQSSVEGRGHNLQEARELQGRAVRSVPAGVPPNGAKGRLCDGAPSDRGEGAGSLSPSDGDGASRGSRPDEQCSVQPVAVQVESGPQAVRASRFTTSDLARITPFHLTGKVWCVKVPTGAFVARRNGKVFVTGNSGFPKSLDVSKAIDKAAGAERGEGRPYVAPDGKPRPSVVSDWGYADARNDVDGRRRAALVSDPTTDAARQWSGWGTALKPAHEPIILARKPLIGTVAKNVLKHGTGGINIDGCRIGTSENLNGGAYKSKGEDEDSYQCIDPNCPDAATMPYHDHPSEKRKGRHDGAENWRYKHGGAGGFEQPKGRWPANVILSHSSECQQIGTRTVKGGTAYEPEAGREMKRTILGGTKNLGRTLGYADEHGNETIPAWECAPDCPVRLLDEQTGTLTSGKLEPHHRRATLDRGTYQSHTSEIATKHSTGGSSGGASRFFYTAKASRSERTHGGTVENKHPTVKPISLMRYLVRLVTPPGGSVLDPFCGSGSTLVAAELEGFDYLGIEQDPESHKTACERLANAEVLRKKTDPKTTQVATEEEP